MKRIAWIDAAKGFAIILVVLGHAVRGYMNAGTFPEHAALLQGVYDFIYSFHMPLFFMISGLLFGLAYCTGTIPGSRLRRPSFVRQLKNLIFLYVVYSLLLGVLKLLLGGFVNRTVSVSDLLLICVKPIELYWYLYVLILYYLIFSADRIRNTPVPVVLTVLFGLSAVSDLMPDIAWGRITLLLSNGIYFYMGMLLILGGKSLPGRSAALSGGRYENEHGSDLSRSGPGKNGSKGRKIVPGGWKTALAAGAAAAVLYGICLASGRSAGETPVVSVLTAAAFSVFFLGVFENSGLLSGLSVFTVPGRYCLEIYVLHTYVSTLLRSLLPRIGISGFWPALILNFLCSLLLPLAAALIAERAGLHRWLFRPFRK